MLDLTLDIQPLTTFRRRPGDFIKQLKKPKRPDVLTVNGKAAAVVQDAAAYQRLLGVAAQADAREAFVRDSMTQLKDACVRPGSSSRSSKPGMAYAVNISARPQHNLALIYEFIHAADSPAALSWYFGLRNAILSLGELPNRWPVNAGKLQTAAAFCPETSPAFPASPIADHRNAD